MPEDYNSEEKHLTDAKAYKHWQQEIADAAKREKEYRKLGKVCVDLYEAKKPSEVPFSILYSNTETLLPALYNAKPIPVVTRRFRDADPVGKAISETSTRILKFLLDANSADYDTFDETVQTAVLEGLVVNRGVTRFKYVADPGGHECVYGEPARWDKFLHGYARTWKKVPWIGFEWDMTKEEMQENFKGVKWNAKSFTEEEKDEGDSETKEEKTGVRTYKVFEVWDKASRTVIFFSACHPEGLLRKIPDPFELVGFFPTPKPLNFLRKITTLIPTPLYEHYKQQANELNEVTRRLKSIIRAIKYRGAYNAAIEGMEKILEADDNVMVPIENVQVMGENVRMDSLLWTIPVAELATTAQQLYQQREGIKQVIYEITGVSDILRGATQASETATAQNIKNQWGTLRLKKMQKEVQRYVRDCLEIMLEIAASKFELKTIQAMTGLPFMGMEEKQQFQTLGEQAAAEAQRSGQQPPEVPAEVQMLLQLPTWEEVQQALTNDLIRIFKTDIETNSTIDAEAAQDKQDISELLNALSQFLNGLAPLVEQGIMPFEVAKSMLLTISRRYNFGSQLEDSLEALVQPAPKEEKPDPVEMGKLEMMKGQAQAEQAKGEQEFRLKQAEGQAKMAEQQAKMELEALKMELEREKLALAREELAGKMLIEEKKLRNEITIARIRADNDRKIAAEKEIAATDRERIKAEIEADTSLQAAKIAAQSSVDTASVRSKETSDATI